MLALAELDRTAADDSVIRSSERTAMANLTASVQVVYPLSASRSRDLETIARHIGADPRSLRYFQPKRRVRHLFAPRVDYRAAAFVKQELGRHLYAILTAVTGSYPNFDYEQNKLMKLKIGRAHV